MTTAAVAVGVGAFVVGFIAASLLSRRGRRLHLEWRLSINTEDIRVGPAEPEGAAPSAGPAPTQETPD
jgi:hypothetical protein